MPHVPLFDPSALRDARLRRGLTQGQLARAIDVAGGERVSRWELGASEPRPAVVVALAEALDISAADLLVEPSGPPSLRWLRVVAGLTTRELAERAHLSQPTVHRWEMSGVQRDPSRDTLLHLATALGTDVATVRSALHAR